MTYQSKSISKYKDLEIEITKTSQVPVIVGALGMIKKKRTDKHINKESDSPS